MHSKHAGVTWANLGQRCTHAVLLNDKNGAGLTCLVLHPVRVHIVQVEGSLLLARGPVVQRAAGPGKLLLQFC